MINPLHNLPTGITEDDILDLVEHALPEARAQVVRAALAASRPDLLRLVDAMHVDRRALASMEPPRAPAGLVAAAATMASRDHPLTDIVEPEVTTLRVSTYKPHRRPGVLASIADLLTSSTLARGLAVAAGFSLAAGVLLWGILAIVAEISQPVRIANNDDPAPTITERRDPLDRQDPQVALSDEPQIESTDPTDALASTDQPGEEPLDPDLDPLPAAAGMDGQRALALAREGRLAVRVRVGSTDLALARIENLRRQAQREGVLWRTLSAEFSTPIYVAMAESTARPSPAPRPGSNPPTIAGDPAATTPGAPPRSRDLPDFQPPTGRLAAAYELQLPDSATTLESLRRALTRDRFQVAEFIELPNAVPTEPILDPRTIFWWDQPPSAWERKIRVPVLVETLD